MTRKTFHDPTSAADRIRDEIFAACEKLAEMPGIYLNKSEMDGFVQRATSKLETIIDMLRSGAPIPTEHISALEL